MSLQHFSIHKFPLHHNVYDSNGKLKSMIDQVLEWGKIRLFDSSKSNIFYSRWFIH